MTAASRPTGLDALPPPGLPVAPSRTNAASAQATLRMKSPSPVIFFPGADRLRHCRKKPPAVEGADPAPCSRSCAFCAAGAISAQTAPAATGYSDLKLGL